LDEKVYYYRIEIDVGFLGHKMKKLKLSSLKDVPIYGIWANS
jgi:hypothetical protein